MTTADATTTMECDDDYRMRPRRKNNALSVPSCAREDMYERRDAGNEREEYWTERLYELYCFFFVIQTFFRLFG